MPFTALRCLVQGTATDEPAFGGSHDGYICVRVRREEHAVGAIQIDFRRVGHVEHDMLRHVLFGGCTAVDCKAVFLHLDINSAGSLVVEYNDLLRVLVDIQFTAFFSDFVRQRVAVQINRSVVREGRKVETNIAIRRHLDINRRRMADQLAGHSAAVIQDRIDNIVGNGGRCGFNNNVAAVIAAIAVNLGSVIGVDDNRHRALCRRAVHLHIANDMRGGDHAGGGFIAGAGQVRLHLVTGRTAICIDRKVGLQMACVYKFVNRNTIIQTGAKDIFLRQCVIGYGRNSHIMGNRGNSVFNLNVLVDENAVFINSIRIIFNDIICTVRPILKGNRIVRDQLVVILLYIYIKALVTGDSVVLIS